MELLAPAGSEEALLAAVRNGADAVYLGYTAFGARGSAANFDEAQLRKAVRFCHAHGVRVHVTVNTLVKQAEMQQVMSLFSLLCEVGADAVIVQDFGVLACLRAEFPTLPVHASTQMALHNVQGVQFARAQGVRRVVAARECTMGELRAMAGVGLEIEAFVHGALCVSVSGQCLFSSMIGGRSGNRGRCAQPCRLPYRMGSQAGALLSPRDQMLMAQLPDLRDAGVYSLKIEGRMKRAAYVAVVTRAYREALERMARGEDPSPDAQTLRALQQIFHRGGFTCGYTGGAEDADLLCWTHAGHAGLPMGCVRTVRDGFAHVALTEALHDGDGLQIRREIECTYAGHERAAGEEAIVRCPAGVRTGDAVFRLTDACQIRQAESDLACETQQRAVSMTLTAYPGSRASLRAESDGFCVCVETQELVQPAQNRELTEADAYAQLQKTGNTGYRLTDWKVQTAHAFLPVGALNALRRQALEALTDARVESLRIPIRTKTPECRLPTLPATNHRSLIVRTSRVEEIPVLQQAGADVVEWTPDDVREEAMTAAISHRLACRIVLPQVSRTEELAWLRVFLEENSGLFTGIVATNPAHLQLQLPLPCHADASLHVYNPWAAQFLLQAGCQTLTASPELSLAEVKALLACGGDYVLNAYGREQLMLLTHCPVRVGKGLRTGRAHCNLCAQGMGIQGQYLTDRQGYRFPMQPLHTAYGCLIRLYNSVPTDLTNHFAKLRGLCASMRLSFVDEPLAERVDIVMRYRRWMDAETVPAQKVRDTTSAHYFRGVE